MAMPMPTIASWSSDSGCCIAGSRSLLRTAARSLLRTAARSLLRTAVLRRALHWRRSRGARSLIFVHPMVLMVAEVPVVRLA
eukprot:6123058-Prymnesium_polylepis.1